MLPWLIGYLVVGLTVIGVSVYLSPPRNIHAGKAAWVALMWPWYVFLEVVSALARTRR